MAEGWFKQLPDGTWIAVEANEGVVATAESRTELRDKTRPIGQCFSFCLRKNYAVIAFASQSCQNVGGSKLA